MDEYEDQFWGQGGSYTVDEHGQRVRVEATQDHPQGNRAREVDDAVVAQPLAVAVPAPEPQPEAAAVAEILIPTAEV